MQAEQPGHGIAPFAHSFVAGLDCNDLSLSADGLKPKEAK